MSVSKGMTFGGLIWPAALSVMLIIKLITFDNKAEEKHHAFKSKLDEASNNISNKDWLLIFPYGIIIASFFLLQILRGKIQVTLRRNFFIYRSFVSLGTIFMLIAAYHP